jgi:plasmid stabilization system protein ParE
LSRALRAEVKAKLIQIQENPRLYSRVLDTVRQAPLYRFPYSIIYFEWENHDTVIVLAIFHQARNPEAWKRRWSGLEES